VSLLGTGRKEIAESGGLGAFERFVFQFTSPRFQLADGHGEKMFDAQRLGVELGSDLAFARRHATMVRLVV